MFYKVEIKFNMSENYYKIINYKFNGLFTLRHTKLFNFNCLVRFSM